MSRNITSVYYKETCDSDFRMETSIWWLFLQKKNRSVKRNKTDNLSLSSMDSFNVWNFKQTPKIHGNCLTYFTQCSLLKHFLQGLAWMTNKHVLTWAGVSLLRMTCSKWGGRIGGPLCLPPCGRIGISCAYSPGGELDNSVAIETDIECILYNMNKTFNIFNGLGSQSDVCSLKTNEW